MLNAIANLLHLVVAVSTPEPEHLSARMVENQFQVELGKKVIFRKESSMAGLPRVSRAGKVGDEEYLLIEDYHGDGCPSMYTLVTKTKGGRHQEHLVGNCNEVKVKEDDYRLELSFPAHAEIPSRKAAEWVYGEETLKKVF